MSCVVLSSSYHSCSELKVKVAVRSDGVCPLSGVGCSSRVCTDVCTGLISVFNGRNLLGIYLTVVVKCLKALLY